MSQRSKNKAGPERTAAVPSGTVGLNDRWTVLGVCVVLAVAVWLVFGQTVWHEFVNYDDDVFVYENPQVQGGLTWHGIAWAFRFDQGDYWHPVTWRARWKVRCMRF